MKKSDTIRAVFVDGRAYQRHPDGVLTPLADHTDYARIDAGDANQADQIAAADTDGPPMSDEEWTRGAIRQPVKIPVGLKLDDDVLQWFKQQGRGYQTRINSVLRRYVDAHRKVG